MNIDKIYLSGPDGAGKSTMAKILSLTGGYEIEKWSKPLPDEKLADRIERATGQILSDRKTVFDRGWYGDVIYAPIFGSDPVINMEASVRLLRLFIEKGGLLVYVKASEDKLIERIARRGDEHVTPDMMFDIVEAYELFFLELKNVHQIPFLTIDTTNLF